MSRVLFPLTLHWQEFSHWLTPSLKEMVEALSNSVITISGKTHGEI